MEKLPTRKYLAKLPWQPQLEDEDDEAEYQSYRQRALVYGEIVPNVNTMQIHPGNSQAVFQ